ncbi:hypothetical protein BK798_06340 [Methanobrevibacter smithii]|jgi:hypothetical protein|uniref:Uncharacterized protein n=2 Tax=Methanobrevibacter smithii TaxID=2173 RepID=A0A2H4U7I0_METSM|nr:hypothetical protein BK798_06340 [Methanobrevibacter smithii]
MRKMNSIWMLGIKLFFRSAYMRIQYIPFSPFPKQAEMILAREKEVQIGGAAGGSKSTSLLMRALFYVQDDANEYHALILRCTLSDLKRKGALIHKARQWLNRKEIQNNASIKPK